MCSSYSVFLFLNYRGSMSGCLRSSCTSLLVFLIDVFLIDVFCHVSCHHQVCLCAIVSQSVCFPRLSFPWADAFHLNCYCPLCVFQVTVSDRDSPRYGAPIVRILSATNANGDDRTSLFAVRQVRQMTLCLEDVL